jgi:geranylgeranyl pyrophosphate synthase
VNITERYCQDDVLNLRGFQNSSKDRGEDLAQGKITYPVAKAIALLPRDERCRLWETLKLKPSNQSIIDELCELIESCGGLAAAQRDSERYFEEAWNKLDQIIKPSLAKVLLRAISMVLMHRTI